MSEASTRNLDIAVERVVGFAQKFDRAHFDLACHAAFPQTLTPDLIYQIWLRFVPQAPWTAVARVLLSRLCREVGYELYEMDVAVRNLLLTELKEDEQRFGKDRLGDLADFYTNYLEQQFGSEESQRKDLTQAQHWIPIAFAKPNQLSRELAKAIQSRLKQKNWKELFRLASFIEFFPQALVEFEAPLITYARGMLSFTTGDIKGAREQFRKLPRRGRKVNIVGVNLSIPDEVGLVEIDEKPEPKKKVMVEAKIDFAIITAIEIERLAVCEAFQITDEDRVPKGARMYWRKRLQLEDNEFYEIVVTQLPDAAAVDAALAVSDTIHKWKPEAVLMVGIAGAAKEGVKLGDLVLGREVCYYGRGKETVDGTLPEPQYYFADATLWGQVISVPTWDSPIPVIRPDGKDVRPNIHYGVIASSERVVATADILDEIAADNRKIAAIEMEGYGVSAATFKQYSPVRCLVIRAIGDLADASKHDNWQPYAAAVAAEFTKYFLLDKPLEPQNLPPPTPPLRLFRHYKLLEQAIILGQLIPFLGKEINSCDRPPGDSKWQPGSSYPPSDSELADYLAKNYDTPFFESEIRESNYEQLLEQEPAGKLGPDEFFISSLFPNQRLVAERNELSYLAQYIDITFGSLGLYTELHEIFAKEYRPNQLHEFFAQLPRTMQQNGYRLPYQLIVTTNYDDTLERAFEVIQQPFDLVSYIAKGELRGKFLHQPYAGEPIVIEAPNVYDDFPLGKHPVILKLYGAVDRATAQEDNFVITEDHYMDYLLYCNIPISLVNLMRNNHILFLGHDLSHWTQRSIFRRIWQDRPLDRRKSWVVRENLRYFEKEIWQKNQVDIVEIPSESTLGAYITELNKQVQAIPPSNSHYENDYHYFKEDEFN